MTTFSLGVTAAGAGQKFGQKVDKVPDDVVPTSGTITVATAGGLAYCTARNVPFLAQDASGRSFWAVYDPERSTFDRPILRRI